AGRGPLDVTGTRGTTPVIDSQISNARGHDHLYPSPRWGEGGWFAKRSNRVRGIRTISGRLPLTRLRSAATLSPTGRGLSRAATGITYLRTDSRAINPAPPEPSDERERVHHPADRPDPRWRARRGGGGRGRDLAALLS